MVRLLLAAALAVQEPRDPREVQPERPTVATHAYAVAPGYLEVEVGVERDRYAPGQVGGLLPNIVKIGIVPRFQLNLSLPLVTSPGVATGIGDASVGFKWQLLSGAPVIADFSIVPTLKFATGHDGRGTGTTDVSLWLVSSRHLGPIAVDLNVGALRRSGDGSVAPRTATVWTVSTGGPFGGPVGWVVELYGYPGTSGPAGQAPTVALLAGPTISAMPWLSFDAGIIAPLRGPQPRAIYAGSVINVGRLFGR